MLLRSALLCLLNTLVAAQSQQLSVNSLHSFSPASLPDPPLFTLPTANALTITVALCSDISQSLTPRFFVTNSSIVKNSGSGADAFEIDLRDGHGSWTGSFTTGGVLRVENANHMTFEVGLSDIGESFRFTKRFRRLATSMGMLALFHYWLQSVRSRLLVGYIPDAVVFDAYTDLTGRFKNSHSTICRTDTPDTSRNRFTW
jgi:calcium channel MID1